MWTVIRVEQDAGDCTNYCEREPIHGLEKNSENLGIVAAHTHDSHTPHLPESQDNWHDGNDKSKQGAC